MKHSFKICFPRLYDVKSHSDFINHSVSTTDTGTTRIHYTLFQNLHLSYLESGKVILISKCGPGRLPNSLQSQMKIHSNNHIFLQS